MIFIGSSTGVCHCRIIFAERIDGINATSQTGRMAFLYSQNGMGSFSALGG